MASNSDGSGSNGTSPRNLSINASRDYDTLKQQYEKANSELSNSRRRCDHALNDLDYFREQHRAAMNQLEVSSQDSASLRTRYSELLSEKQRLEQENQRLRKELNEVHRQQQDVVLLAENGNSDSLYISHSQALSKLELAKDENNRLAKQFEQERNNAQREIDSLKQQVLKYYKAHQKVQQQYEEAEKQIVAIKIKANKEVKRLTDERNATLAEYTLVMSERDQVHKEMEKLSDDLAQALKKGKMLDADNQELVGEKQAIGYQLESLRREIASALYERDKALKECADLREKFGELGASNDDNRRREQTRSRHLEGLGGPCENVGRKDALQSDVRTIGQRQRLDNLDQANQELESLRKSLDKAQTELSEAIQEAEVSKGRRDWAFSERDKIVQERESIRTLCDNMRKERDRAVSELAESLRESDALKKQRNELLKEVKALKEMLEAHIVDHDDDHFGNHSDIDDSTEILEVELTCDGTADLGLELAGGRDDPHFPGDGAVYVAAVAEGSIADGKLRPNDRISRVNDVDCSAVSRRMVIEAIRASLPVARIVVSRRRRRGPSPSPSIPSQVTKWVHTARLVPGCHGLTLNTGVYISRISDGSLAAKDKSLSIGDRILRINEKSMDDIESIHEAMRVLNDDSVDVITVTALKISHPECPNVFTPVRRHKRENRSSQTDEHDYLSNQQEKNNGGAWFKEKIDLMRGRRHTKDNDKKKYRNSSPSPLELADPEQAIAELDLVLDSYRGNANVGTVKRTKRGTKEQEKNGGTWPKAKATALLQPVLGSTVVVRNKERPPLSLLKEAGAEYHRNSTPVPLPIASMGPRPSNRHSVYKSVDGGGSHFSTTGDSFEKLRSPPSNRLSANMNSDNSLDYPVHRYADKDVHTYYKKNKLGKYAFDCDRDSVIGHTESSQGNSSVPTSHSRIHSQFWVPPRTYYPFHPHPHVDFDHSIHHTHSPSVDGASRKMINPVGPMPYRETDLLEGGTFPRKNQRFVVPSNPSITSKVSTGSIERSSERGSPMPIFHVEVLSPGEAGSSGKECCSWVGGQYKPLPGELRRVHIDKSNEPLGIQINCRESGGIFVSTVNDNSLASRVGLQIGDQLLEVCGINMRNATYNLAANVLRQCGNSITMLVQYSPDKYNELEGSGSCSGSSSNDDEGDGETTPCNSPKEIRKSHPVGITKLPPPTSLLRVGQQSSSLQRQNNSSRDDDEPRFLYIETLKTSNLGISLVGGNAAGIFIHSVQPDSLAYHAGLRTGDQILEYNGSDLRNATAEEAAYELAKPADKVTVSAHYRIDRYNEIKDKPGDSLYVRCGFDRSGNEHTEPPQLAFAKDDVLYVDNTMFNGVPGQWRAWRLDNEGRRQQCGVIPSKYKVEEEMLLRRGADLDQTGRPVSVGSSIARRSFFRRKKHQRHSKELASFCSLAGPGWYSDGGSLHEEPAPPPAYQRVERLPFPEFRPVLVLGPLAECVVDKLVSDFPDEFGRAPAETRRCSQAQLDRELADGHLVEYRRRGSCWECVTVAAVRQVSRAHLHCMLDVAASSVERLHRHGIYPVVLLIKFKSTKQIREVKDALRYSLDKLSGKAAKEMFEHGHKLEAEYRHLVTAVVAAGANVAHVCAQVKAAVDAEHRKSQWVPVG
ncbi:disks large homolog 5 [Tribolium madens]|uniref:disks large homolog 5 n=1 Tax=Tribolium madens TaxID=41895 RepID=UPI001CF71F79|nr:disks large homolog 5 [Tribolium madens]